MNWIIRYYSRTGKHLHDEIVRDRTEFEARREIENNLPYGVADWTMTEWKGK